MIAVEKWSARFQRGEESDMFEAHTSQTIVFLGVRPCQLIVMPSTPKTINLLKTQHPEASSDETKTCPMHG
jgi:hypothetical protein